jgi:hypothetical protein
VQRNIAQIEITTTKVNEMVVEQRVKLKVDERRGALDSMARAAGMFGVQEEDIGNLAKLIEEAAERARKAGTRTFDGKTGLPIQEGEIVG